MQARIKKAHDFAAAYCKQESGVTGESQLTHLEETAQLLWKVTEGQADNDDYIVAILHNIVEDASIDLKEIGRNFGKCVMDMVNELTDNSADKDKKSYLVDKLNAMSSRVLTIKLCSVLSNVFSLEHNTVTETFAKQYIKEVLYVINNLNRELNTNQKHLIGRIKKMLLYIRINRKL